MYLLLQIILMLIGCSFFFIKRVYKVSLLFAVMLLFNAISVKGLGSVGHSSVLIPCCYFLSEIKNWSTFRPIRGTVIFKIFLFQIVAAMIAYWHSPLYFGKLSRTLSWMAELLSADIVIGYVYYSIKDRKDLSPIVNTAYYCMIAVTILGVVNLLLHSNPYLQMVASGSGTDSMTMMSTHFDDNYIRFRVQSFFPNPFNYGFASLAILYFFVFARNIDAMKKSRFVAMLICCMFGVLTCGCRTIYLIFFMSAMIYVLYSYNLGKKLRILFVTFFIGFFSYSLIIPVQELVDKTLSVFTDTTGKEVSGSNLQMRGEQLAAVVMLTNGSETFGKGRGYFTEELGWGSDNFQLWELKGLEGLYLSKLLERGIVGLVFWIIVYTSLLFYFYKRRNVPYKAGLIGFITIFSYMMFSNMTGELSSLYPTTLVAGIMISFTPPVWVVINLLLRFIAQRELNLIVL